MAHRLYFATSLTGGAAGALDSFDGNATADHPALADKDGAHVTIKGGLQYFYVLNATSGAAESSPDVIKPDSNAGTKRWILIGTVLPLATVNEINTGTEANKLISPDTLAGSYAGTKAAIGVVFAPTTTNATGDGKFEFPIPASLNGMNLVSVFASVTTAGTTGVETVQIRNKTQAVDMLSTEITIDTGETSSATAAAPPVINEDNDGVVTNDIIAIDIDTVHTTPAAGLQVVMNFRLP